MLSSPPCRARNEGYQVVSSGSQAHLVNSCRFPMHRNCYLCQSFLHLTFCILFGFKEVSLLLVNKQVKSIFKNLSSLVKPILICVEFTATQMTHDFKLFLRKVTTEIETDDGTMFIF